MDRDGLDTYICNRKIGATGGDTSRPRWNPFTHTFLFITDSDGNVIGTFSWGNTADPRGWSLDQDEDMGAARGALRNGKAKKVRDASFDRFVEQAYLSLKAHSARHANGWILRNCKTEAANLRHQAELFEEMDQNEDMDFR